MNAQATASVIAAAVASGPGWAMFASQRAANRRHSQRLTALHAKVDRLTTSASGGADNPHEDGGDT